MSGELEQQEIDGFCEGKMTSKHNGNFCLATTAQHPCCHHPAMHTYVPLLFSGSCRQIVCLFVCLCLCSGHWPRNGGRARNILVFVPSVQGRDIRPTLRHLLVWSVKSKPCIPSTVHILPYHTHEYNTRIEKSNMYEECASNEVLRIINL